MSNNVKFLYLALGPKTLILKTIIVDNAMVITIRDVEAVEYFLLPLPYKVRRF